MADFKRVILKDPVSGENLMPVVPDILQYEIIEGQEVAPFEFEAPPSDASTLEGYPASYFATAAEAAELKTSVSEGKTLIAAAVTDKGVQTAADATFATIAANIASISTGAKKTTGIAINASNSVYLQCPSVNENALSYFTFTGIDKSTLKAGDVFIPENTINQSSAIMVWIEYRNGQLNLACSSPSGSTEYLSNHTFTCIQL